MSNIFYAQSGGPTSVINASACGVIETARQHKDHFGTVFAGKNGILGALNEELIDTSLESDENIRALMHTPSSAFGTCRFKLKSIEEDESQFKRLIEVFKAHDISTFFYNGGNDSQDTAHKVSQMGERLGYPLTCIGIPKTIDNDLPHTDCCPGFGSVAKYVAISTLEAALDVRAMAASSTKVFILEVMGRHAGWIAASSVCASNNGVNVPHIILLPEVKFNQQAFLDKVQKTVDTEGYCVIVASEGIQNKQGAFLAESGLKDAFGHSQLGGVAPVLASMVQGLGLKNHWAVSDYLQRAARHIASETDLLQAYAMGQKAVEAAIAGENNVMVAIERLNANPYNWQTKTVPLKNVANVEHTLPADFISEDGMHVTEKCREYISPLIKGESYPPYENGVPQYAKLKCELTQKRT